MEVAFKAKIAKDPNDLIYLRNSRNPAQSKETKGFLTTVRLITKFFISWKWRRESPIIEKEFCLTWRVFSFFPFLTTRKKPTNENSLFMATVIVITQMGTGPDIFYGEWLKKQWHRSWKAGLVGVCPTNRRTWDQTVSIYTEQTGMAVMVWIRNALGCRTGTADSWSSLENSLANWWAVGSVREQGLKIYKVKGAVRWFNLII